MKGFALLVAPFVATACGRELHHTVDAAPPDASIDAPEDNGDPPGDAVTLTITRLGSPVQGVVVVFQDPSSTVIATATTDLAGRAWADMPTGGFVTAVESTGMQSDELTTFATVAAGDALRLDHTPPHTGTDRTVSVTLAQLDAGANDGYTIHTACGTGGADIAGTGSIELSQCGTSADVVVASTLDGLPTGRGYHLANVAMPDAGGNVALTGTFAAFTDVTLTYQDVPTEVQSIVAQQVLSATARAFVASDSAVPTSGAATLAVAMPTTTATLLTETTLYPTTGELGQQQLFAWSTPAPTVTTNLGTEMIPAYASAPVYDLGSHAVTWTERSGGAAGQLVRAGLQVHRDDIPEGRAWRWRIAGARGATTALALPALPAIQGFDFAPAATDTIVVDELTTARLPATVPWRAQAFAPLLPLATSTTTTGALVIQTLYSEQL